ESQALAAAQGPAGADAFPLQRREAGIAEGILRQPGDVLARDSKVTQRDRDVGFRAAEIGVEMRRREQPFLAGRAQPEQRAAEGDDAGHEERSSDCRAARTSATKARARSASSAGGAPTSAPPTLTAAAPARIHSLTRSRVMPPDGTMRNCGSGPSRSCKNPGPTVAAGNSFTSAAPARQAP